MENHNVNWLALRDFCQQLMEKEGMSPADAYVCADNLVDADLSGVESHGVSRMTNYMKRLRIGVVNPKGACRVVQENASSLSIDADNAMGMVAGKYAMERCIEKARQTGCCFATVKHSNHFGMAAYYVKMAAEAGMLGFTATNAPPNLAPWGSSQKYMGTNPFSVAVPTHGEALLLDMAPSVVAMGKIILAAKLGQKIPEGWVVTKDGRPTTDPVEGQYGTLLPVGGPKGSGIAIFVEVLCGVLAGAQCGPHINHFWKDFENPQDVGHVFMALDISKLMSLDEFKDRVGVLIDELKSLPRNPGVDEIFMPGEIENRKRAARKAEGLMLSHAVYEELRALAQQYDAPFEL